jgi:RNA-directed DNA polymerase
MNKRQVHCVGGGLTWERVHSSENLFAAWREFRRGKRKKREIQEFEFKLEDNLFELQEALAGKTYEHWPYQSFYVQDPKLRHIHKACVRDRVLHQALFRILYPIFDRNFIFDSYSCREGKGTHRGVARLETFARKLSANYRKPVFALKCDIRKFFDSIDQGILMELVRKKVKDPDVLWLIEKIIGSFRKVEGRGLPLGNVTSQLFANVYLNELDQFMKHRLKARYYLRYCDDFIVLGGSEKELQRIIPAISDFLERELRFSLHKQKIVMRKLSRGVDFLGYVVLPHYRVMRTKTKRRILRKVSTRNLQSYLGVLSHCRGHKIAKKINDIMKQH